MVETEILRYREVNGLIEREIQRDIKNGYR